jgi:cytosine/adenosine deaminase-related metal-dependent hydrolase
VLTESGLMSGFVNAHTHLYSGLASLGLSPAGPPPLSFLQILERIWWRLDRALDETSLRAAARYAAADALLHGTSCLIDHHESPNLIEGSLDILADACQTLGIRAVLCYGATERNGGREEARRGLAECRRFIRTNTRPLVRGVVGLHASFTVSDETIREAGELCRELGTTLHTHVAEDRMDVEVAHIRGYEGPLQRLQKLDALPAGSILAHGVHLSPAETRQAEALGCWLVQNPRSNRYNGVGYPSALVVSPRVALGTDGFPSDMVDELQTLVQEAREHGEDVGLVGRRLTTGQLIAAEHFAAPVLATSDRPPQMTPCQSSPHPGPGGARDTDSGDHFAHARASQAKWTDRLVVDGRLVVSDGRLQTADWGEIVREANVEAERLWARMRDLALT